MPTTLKLAELRHFSDYFRNFPYDRGFLACALAEPDAAIYVDNFLSPKVVLLSGKSTVVHFVWGDVEAAQAVGEKMMEIGRQTKRRFEILSAADESWRSAFAGYSEQEAWHVPRVDYQNCTPLLPSAISADLEAAKTVDILPLQGELIDRALKECDLEFDPDYFRRHHGMGFVAIDRGRIVWAAWTPIIGSWTNLAIATNADYRRRGLALRLGAAVVEECLLRGVRPHVTTGQGNIAARAWARRLGFGGELLHDWVVLRTA